MADYETVREIALALPNVEDSLSYGAPALKVNGKEMFVRWREEMDAIVLKTTFEEREELLETDPDVYFITDHYLNYEYVLVKLRKISRKSLADMIRRSYALASEKKRRKKI